MKQSYSPAVALDFFKTAGKPEKAAKGNVFFAENQKARPLLFMRDRMYLLLDGEVDMVARGKVIGTVVKGQVFGEMAEGLSSDEPVYYDRGKSIVQEGQTGLRMYAVLEAKLK